MTFTWGSLPSGDNPSDDGTRYRSIRDPSAPLPPSFLPLAQGDVGPLDRGLSEQPELSPEVLQEKFVPEMVDELPTLASDSTWAQRPVLSRREPPSVAGFKSGRARRARRNRAKRAAKRACELKAAALSTSKGKSPLSTVRSLDLDPACSALAALAD